MKKLFIILSLVFGSLLANCQSQFVFTGTDTLKCVFTVSSSRYEHANIIAKQGYIVRAIFSYTGDKMPCIGEDSDCDYSDHHKTIAYLDNHKKEFTESKWHVWSLDLIQ